MAKKCPYCKSPFVSSWSIFKGEKETFKCDMCGGFFHADTHAEKNPY